MAEQPSTDSDSSDESLAEREKALAHAFYRGGAEEYLENLRLRLQEEAAKEDLASATGIDDPGLLGELASLGIRADTLAALTLIPLIEVAWVDGVMDERERDAALRGAVSTGLPVRSPSYELLRLWIRERPAPLLTKVWKEYIGALCARLSATEVARLEANVLGRAKRVAAAAGDALDRAPHVSREEEALLDELRLAFHG